ncbi:hypothetical protein P3T27_002643 [Kitasatospora sp. MAA19]|uniref:DUF397 domain-containing protein n=1 Tax=Kitasatospora sp. MAA19 TaxID=3035090 RepID=UPI002474CB96|nr:DUF397 domain-containing protein [Kitasatospora sp. MAA19]MDH6705921.1 hypothetical protein [Kitasatospora sp. MAA19]
MDVDLTGAYWRKSSYSGSGGTCVEVADGFIGMMPVRDSKDPSGPPLLFSSAAWQSFVTAVRTGELDAR